jgi:hypothetical protein
MFTSTRSHTNTIHQFYAIRITGTSVTVTVAIPPATATLVELPLGCPEAGVMSVREDVEALPTEQLAEVTGTCTFDKTVALPDADLG